MANGLIALWKPKVGIRRFYFDGGDLKVWIATVWTVYLNVFDAFLRIRGHIETHIVIKLTASHVGITHKIVQALFKCIATLTAEAANVVFFMKVSHRKYEEEEKNKNESHERKLKSEVLKTQGSMKHARRSYGRL